MRIGSILFKSRQGMVGCLAFSLLAMAALAQTDGDASEEDTAVGSAETALNHRPLRLNQVPETPLPPTEPQTFSGYPDAPEFEVVSRKDALVFYPCANCHAALPPNPTPRKLIAAPHPAALDHGQGRMWCTDCHTLDDRNNLHTINGEPVDFNESYTVCGQCHTSRTEDWYFGAHGKRVSNWQGQRTLYNCTHCHDPHSPGLKPREPFDPPPVRAGLVPMQLLEHDTAQLWEEHAEPTDTAPPDAPAHAPDASGVSDGETGSEQ